MKKEIGRVVYPQDTGSNPYVKIAWVTKQICLGKSVRAGNVSDEAKRLQVSLRDVGIDTTLTPVPTSHDVDIVLEHNSKFEERNALDE
ncbi:hypothetical protein HQ403_00865 [Candidatus Kaiserbacteria bacterium]|nr:hypothetical protein [Candidatus Kaiserbacteria bacterium]